jgi:hypothetical protein
MMTTMVMMTQMEVLLLVEGPELPPMPACTSATSALARRLAPEPLRHARVRLNGRVGVAELTAAVQRGDFELRTSLEKWALGQTE